ncbi:MAG: hypothetical protein IH971_03935 [Candidatus Marinimicrobia bacterium]|nr:hypothetical protein [Candidatus Neomarinimicrobiota bacterium]
MLGAGQTRHGNWVVLTAWVALLPGVELMRGQELTVQPIAFAMHRSTGGLWQREAAPISFAGIGARATASYGRWSLTSEAVNMRFVGEDALDLPNRFMPEQGFSWQSRSAGRAEEFDTDHANAKISYDAGRLIAFAGKFSQSWGPGLHSLTLSQKPPSYPQFGFDWQVLERLHFSYMHAQLVSGLVDSSRDFGDLLGGRFIQQPRFLAAHRLDVDLFETLTLGLTESVVYGGRGMETIYLIPFVFYWSAQHNLGDLDNLQMSADLTWRPSSDLKVYGVFVMDEWTPGRTFSEDDHNWFAWQAGLAGRSLLANSDRLIIEASWTDQRVYRHRVPVNDYYSHRYPLGHWTGPHAQSLYAAYVYPLAGMRLMGSYLYAKRGEVTEQMTIDKYRNMRPDRFSGPVKAFESIELKLGRRIYRDLWGLLGVSVITWTDDAALDHPTELTKTSINLGFYYNFNLKSYDISLIQPH